MEIQTKFNVGDTVYRYVDMEIVEYRVDKITISIESGLKPNTVYSLINDDTYKHVSEQIPIFKTKKECKEYAIKYINDL